jgi:hypothetical protein
MIKKILSGLVVLILIIIISIGFTNQNPSFSIKFEILNNESSVSSTNQFCARIIFINLNHATIEVAPYIQYGYDGTDPFTVQAFDLDNNEINISTNTDYDWIVSDNLIQFQKGVAICDTICSEEFYHFPTKGTYKLRLMFKPENLYIKNGKITGQIIYSNWDTLIIR